MSEDAHILLRGDDDRLNTAIWLRSYFDWLMISND